MALCIKPVGRSVGRSAPRGRAGERAREAREPGPHGPRRLTRFPREAVPPLPRPCLLSLLNGVTGVDPPQPCPSSGFHTGEAAAPGLPEQPVSHLRVVLGSPSTECEHGEGRRPRLPDASLPHGRVLPACTGLLTARRGGGCTAAAQGLAGSCSNCNPQSERASRPASKRAGEQASGRAGGRPRPWGGG